MPKSIDTAAHGFDAVQAYWHWFAGPTMVVVHGCKKQSGKARKADLDVARKRMKQVLDDERQRKQTK